MLRRGTSTWAAFLLWDSVCAAPFSRVDSLPFPTVPPPATLFCHLSGCWRQCCLWIWTTGSCSEPLALENPTLAFSGPHSSLWIKESDSQEHMPTLSLYWPSPNQDHIPTAQDPRLSYPGSSKPPRLLCEPLSRLTFPKADRTSLVHACGRGGQRQGLKTQD